MSIFSTCFLIYFAAIALCDTSYAKPIEDPQFDEAEISKETDAAVQNHHYGRYGYGHRYGGYGGHGGYGGYRGYGGYGGYGGHGGYGYGHRGYGHHGHGHGYGHHGYGHHG